MALQLQKALRSHNFMAFKDSCSFWVLAFSCYFWHYVIVPNVTIPNVTIPNVTIPNVTIPNVTILNVTIPNVTIQKLITFLYLPEASLACLGPPMVAPDRLG